MAIRWTKGGVDLVFNAKKDAFTLARGEDYNGDEGTELAQALIAEAKSAKKGIDKWAVFIPDMKVPDDATTVSATAVAGALKKHGEAVLLARAKTGQPFLLIAEPKAKPQREAKESPIKKIARKS